MNADRIVLHGSEGCNLYKSKHAQSLPTIDKKMVWQSAAIRQIGFHPCSVLHHMTEPSQNSEKASVEQNQRQWSFAERRGLLLVGLSPIIANAIGSIFNILYNQTQIEPMLSEAQHDRFNDCVMFFNLIVYPLAIAGFLVPLLYLRPTHRAILNGEPVDPARLATSQRYVVNLPWWFLAVIAVGWLSCVPVFSAALFAVPEPLSQEVVWHLVTSFLIAGLIAATHSFFAMELVIQKTLFPVFFRQASPADVPGALPLNITTRGFIWAVSAGVCPAISLVLLQVVPHAGNQLQLVSNASSNLQWFVIAVALVGILFSLVIGWMLGKEVAVPVQ